MAQLGHDAHGEVLEPGRVPDWYLGLRLDPPVAEAPEVLVVALAALLHPAVPQPDGTVLYELVTGHPDRDICDRLQTLPRAPALHRRAAVAWQPHP